MGPGNQLFYKKTPLFYKKNPCGFMPLPKGLHENALAVFPSSRDALQHAIQQCCRADNVS
jgi:hypothetical protein